MARGSRIPYRRIRQRRNQGGEILLAKTTPPEAKIKKESIEEKINGLSKSQLKELNAYLDGMKGEGMK